MSGSRADQLLPRLLHDWTASTNEDAKPELYAQKITSLCDIEDVEGFCWTLWQAFIDAAQSASGESLRQIDRLVQLVEAIKKANPLLDKNGRVAACWGGECWKDLPLLGPQMRENWSTSRRSRWVFLYQMCAVTLANYASRTAHTREVLDFQKF